MPVGITTKSLQSSEPLVLLGAEGCCRLLAGGKQRALCYALYEAKCPVRFMETPPPLAVTHDGPTEGAFDSGAKKHPIVIVSCHPGPRPGLARPGLGGRESCWQDPTGAPRPRCWRPSGHFPFDAGCKFFLTLVPFDSGFD